MSIPLDAQFTIRPLNGISLTVLGFSRHIKYRRNMSNSQRQPSRASP